jgi:hypothetical protein
MQLYNLRMPTLLKAYQAVTVAEAPHAASMLDSSSVMLCTLRFSVLGHIGTAGG